MKIVSPYRPFVPESAAHRRLGPFDWIAALRMLRVSAQQSAQCEVIAITDVDAALPVPSYAYVTTERRLMLWLLDVCLQYLASAEFDTDTVMVSPDMLVIGDLAPHFPAADLGVLGRLDPKYARHPILNGVQFWRHAAQDRLVAFYRAALQLARALPDALIQWGADTEPFLHLLAPLTYGPTTRAGLRVEILDASRIRERVVVDCKYGRKHQMAAIFQSRFGVPA